MNIRIQTSPIPDSSMPDSQDILASWHGDTLVVAYRRMTSAVAIIARISQALADYENAVLSPRRDTSCE